MNQQENPNQHDRTELFAKLEAKKNEYEQSLKDLASQSEITDKIGAEYKDLVKELETMLADFPEDLAKMKEEESEDFAKNAARFTEKAVGAISDGATALFQSLGKLGNKVGDVLKNTGEKMQAKEEEVKEDLKNAAEDVKTDAQNLADAAHDKAEDVVKDVEEVAEDVSEEVHDTFSNEE